MILLIIGPRERQSMKGILRFWVGSWVNLIIGTRPSAPKRGSKSQVAFLLESCPIYRREEVDHFVNELDSEVVKVSAFAKLPTPYHNRHLEAEAPKGTGARDSRKGINEGLYSPSREGP